MQEVGLTASRKPFVPFPTWRGEGSVKESISDLRIGTLTTDINLCTKELFQQVFLD